jgi:hypothetical protein
VTPAEAMQVRAVCQQVFAEALADRLCEVVEKLDGKVTQLDDAKLSELGRGMRIGLMAARIELLAGINGIEPDEGTRHFLEVQRELHRVIEALHAEYRGKP